MSLVHSSTTRHSTRALSHPHKSQTTSPSHQIPIWFPTPETPHCLHPTREQIIQTMSHILKSCYGYKGLYIAHHNRVVDLITKDIKPSLRMWNLPCSISVIAAETLFTSLCQYSRSCSGQWRVQVSVCFRCGSLTLGKRKPLWPVVLNANHFWIPSQCWGTSADYLLSYLSLGYSVLNLWLPE